MSHPLFTKLSKGQVDQIHVFLWKHSQAKELDAKREKLTIEAMALVDPFLALTGHEKHELVVWMMQQLAKDESNDLSVDLKFGDSVRFFWNMRQGDFGIKLKRKKTGCTAWMCCDTTAVSNDPSAMPWVDPDAKPEEEDEKENQT